MRGIFSLSRASRSCFVLVTWSRGSVVGLVVLVDQAFSSIGVIRIKHYKETFNSTFESPSIQTCLRTDMSSCLLKSILAVRKTPQIFQCLLFPGLDGSSQLLLHDTSLLFSPAQGQIPSCHRQMKRHSFILTRYRLGLSSSHTGAMG